MSTPGLFRRLYGLLLFIDKKFLPIDDAIRRSPGTVLGVCLLLGVAVLAIALICYLGKRLIRFGGGPDDPTG